MINLGSVQMPLTAATKSFAVLAKRGAGKTYAAAVLAEEFHAAAIPFVVFDPIDVWWGLRLKADGKGAGLPVVVFGAEHADLPLEAEMGPSIARAIVAGNVSCVLSTFGMSKRGQRRLIAEFAEELLKINATPRHIFIEEAHEFVPQRIGSDMGATFNAVSNLVVMGRNRGLGVTLVNQRAATINKDVLSQIDTLIALRSVGPQDRAALREWVEHHAAEGDFRAFLESLPSLPTGEGWLWSPEFLGKFERIKIRPRRTFHPDREKLGGQFHMPAPQQGDIQAFIKQFQAGAVTPAQSTHITAPKAGTSMSNMTCVSLRWDSERKALIAEYEAKLGLKDGEIARLQGDIADFQRKLDAIREIVGGAALPPSEPPRSKPSMPGPNMIDFWANKLGPSTGAARILRFLAEKSGLSYTRARVALAVGMAVGGGSFQSYLSDLKRAGLIVEQDGRLAISPDLRAE